MHGDQVLVEITRASGTTAAPKAASCACSPAPTRPSSAHSITARAHNFVTPLDEKVTQDVIIPAGMERPAGSEAEEPAAPPPATPPVVARERSEANCGQKVDRDRVYDSK